MRLGQPCASGILGLGRGELFFTVHVVHAFAQRGVLRGVIGQGPGFGSVESESSVCFSQQAAANADTGYRDRKANRWEVEATFGLLRSDTYVE